MEQRNLLDLSLDQLKEYMKSIEQPEYRAQQVYSWLFKHQVFNIDAMSNLSVTLRQQLQQDFFIKLPEIVDVVKSQADGSYKFLLKANDCRLIEALLMLPKNRVTICVSCMVGCPLKCKFCATGNEIGFIRKLTPSEIIGQVILCNNYLKDHGIAEKITNMVFMGMGEPLLNLEAIKITLEALLSPDGFNYSRKRITLSTAGVVDNLVDLLTTYRVKLAVSLHFPNDELRSQYMPINRKYPLSVLIPALKELQSKTGEEILIEYIMLQGINDQIEHAKELIKLLHGLKVKFNLIPYNPIPSLDAQPSTEDSINKFATYLIQHGIMTTVRRSSATDVAGGCGQFVLKSSKKS
ncbi:MAG: putative dual-specificity RNA methyltransferase RlmN [candidate division TM6 bacterium GW2011_GWF2_32_72]|nr:MAG: putative dual-specificity RNA methyltransferase RlmN [candidate division TM6 bacterium GW2011_GWF2_32_72]